MRLKKFVEFIFEADSEGVKISSDQMIIPVGGTFKSGEYKITNQAFLDSKLPEIMSFFKKYPTNQKIQVEISSMESQVPNQGVGLKPGELATKRAEAISAFLKEKFKDLPNVTLVVSKPQIGPTPWNPAAGDKFDDDKFTKEQRVDLVIKPYGEKITLPAVAKDEYGFSVEYDGSPGSKFETTWSDARFGTWGFTVKGLDKAKKIYDFLMKAQGNHSQDSIWKREEKGKINKEGYNFFGQNHFRKFSKKEDFDEFFNKFGSDISFIGEMPNHFFIKPADRTYTNFIENGLRPLWKSVGKPTTRG